MTTTSTAISDQVIELGGAQVQHGPANDRAYLMKLGQAKPEKILTPLIELCRRHGYGKIFACLPASLSAPFHRRHFAIEARVPGFYRGGDDALFLGRYFNQERRRPRQLQKQEQILALAHDKAGSGARARSLPEHLSMRRCRLSDIPAMAKLYRQVFASYPFPIDDHDFLRQSMSEQVISFGIWHGKRLVALGAAETDREQQNAEMTDFATLPDLRGTGCANILLQKLEKHIAKLGIITAYTIARAISPGMNVTFARQGYEFGGRLINNTNICGKIESMNVWHKQLNTG